MGEQSQKQTDMEQKIYVMQIEKQPDSLTKKKVNQIEKIGSIINVFKSIEWTEIKEEQEEKRKENEKFKNESQFNLEKEIAKKRENSELMNGISSDKYGIWLKIWEN